MASRASVQFGEEAEKPLAAQALKRDQRRHGVFFAKYSGVRSALRVLRSHDTVPYCARF